MIGPLCDQHRVSSARRLEALLLHFALCNTQSEKDLHAKFLDLVGLEKPRRAPELIHGSQPQNRFRHRSLSESEQARILILEQGNYDDELRCRLKHVKLLQDQQYEALSYTWGESDKQNTILCSGESIEVTPNLDAALRRLRFADRPRALGRRNLSISQSITNGTPQKLRSKPRFSIFHGVPFVLEEFLNLISTHQQETN
ncbi:hypothetical protein F5884DRAFT_506886 [Xylogone sp. PMI_703]|nr:hypothetical protein F5884DRAFT_506886 [Xylogone sp. PMI_703]